MSIEIRKKEGYRGVSGVYFDDDFLVEIHESVFGKKPVLPNFESLTQWKQAFGVLEEKQAKNYALRCLTRKNYSSKELIKKFEEKCVSDAVISKVIESLKNSGYLNDEDWMNSFLGAQKAKNCGPQLIMQKLRAKGFTNPDIAIDEDSQKESIQKLLATKYRQKDLSDHKERQKVIAGLMRKGFEFSCIREVLENGPEWT